MYNLSYFKEDDPKVVLDFIHKHPFALVCGCDCGGRPVATQIPLFMEEREVKQILTGHIMKQTDHHKAFEENNNVLCVFTGHHTYVSATWYTNPHQASTWNYMSVHVRGKMKFLPEDVLVEILRKTSLHFEGNNAQSTTVFDNLPEDYLNRLMKAIVGFEVEVEEINNVFKLSQNRDHQSFRNIFSKLSEQDADAQTIAEEMKKREEQLFR